MMSSSCWPHEGAIDVLVNNAGVLGRVGPVGEYTAADMSMS
jgi:NAD(P)-dependent dehydrogenase (short-subunit alcohol dehydrogenase family)